MRLCNRRTMRARHICRTRHDESALSSARHSSGFILLDAGRARWLQDQRGSFEGTLATPMNLNRSQRLNGLANELP